MTLTSLKSRIAILERLFLTGIDDANIQPDQQDKIHSCLALTYAEVEQFIEDKACHLMDIVVNNFMTSQVYSRSIMCILLHNKDRKNIHDHNSVLHEIARAYHTKTKEFSHGISPPKLHGMLNPLGLSDFVDTATPEFEAFAKMRGRIVHTSSATPRTTKNISSSDLQIQLRAVEKRLDDFEQEIAAIVSASAQNVLDLKKIGFWKFVKAKYLT